MSFSAETPTFLLLVVVIILILMAVGVFVLTLVYLRRSQSKKPPSAVPIDQTALPPVEITESEPLQDQASDVDRTPTASLDPSHMPAHPGEVMRVIRDQKTGRVIVQVDGQQYTHIREIRDAQIGRRVLWAIADLIRFTGGMAANPQAVRSVTQTQETEPTTPPPVDIPTNEPPPAVTITSAPLFSGVRAPEPEIVQPGQRYSMVDFFRRGFQREVPVAAAQPGSFIDEIEAILQAYIQARPTPLSQVVHVKTGDTGKLQIEVGLDIYGSPDEVPDPEIRNLIKTAVADWERR